MLRERTEAEKLAYLEGFRAALEEIERHTQRSLGEARATADLIESSVKSFAYEEED